MLARIAGIIGGAVVSLLLASTVYPQSATIEALRNLACGALEPHSDYKRMWTTLKFGNLKFKSSVCDCVDLTHGQISPR